MNKNQKKLWIYGVLVNLNGDFVAKAPGQTMAETQEDAIKYAVNETLGKLKGLLSKDDVIFCVDMTEQAESAGFTLENHYSNFDDHIRPQFKNYKGTITNDVGGGSRELLLEFDSKLTKEEISYDLIRQIEDISKAELINPYTQYVMRGYMNNLIRKDYDSDKALIAGCTGSGKETGTLTTILFHHDRLHNDKKIDETHIHVAVPTIPVTTLELIKELSNVKGMIDSRNNTFYDYNRFKVYMVEKFRKKWYPNLTTKQKLWFNKNVNVVKSVKDIPPSHPQHIVPILLGGFHCIGLRDNGAKLKKGYVGLDKRIGILCIGEAHKFLSNPSNKMWNNINELNRKFLLLVTGTPYDYIYCEDRQIYFDSNEIGLFTWDDLCEEKRLDPQGPYGKYPDVNYYGLPDIKETLLLYKKDHRWEDDINGFTWKKLFTTYNEDGEFKYKDAIIYILKRLVNRSIGFNSLPDGLSIHSAPNLCDEAKKHIIIRLPSGQNGTGVSDYIPKLKKLLEDNNVFDDREILEVYKDGNLGNIKEIINEDKKQTITLTCTKYLTGTDIPRWGSVIFLSPIGNSIKLYEQIVGRIKRPSEGKINCGVFVGNIDEVMNLHVEVAELVSITRDENKSTNEIIKTILENYNVFTGQNDSWSKINFPDLVSRLEELYRKNKTHGVRHCIKQPKVPDDFDLMLDSKKGDTDDVVIMDNGMTDAKDMDNEVVSDESEELEIDDFKKRYKNYLEMMKQNLSKMRVVGFVTGQTTLQGIVKLIELEMKNNLENSWILKPFNDGLELIPKWALDKTQTNIPYFNRWLTKINSDNLPLEDLLEMLGDKNLRDKRTQFYPLKKSVCESMVDTLFDKGDKILDPCAGRGVLLVNWIKLNKKKGKKINTSDIFYNDIDPYMYNVFKKINSDHELGIPEKNIFNEDALNPSNKFKKVIDDSELIISNLPLENQLHNAKKNSYWKGFFENFNQKKYSFVLPNSFVQPGTRFENVKKTLTHVNRCIDKKGLIFVTADNKTQDKCNIKTNSNELNIDLNELDCIPQEINSDILKECKEIFKGGRNWIRGNEYHYQRKEKWAQENGQYEVKHSTKTYYTNIHHENNDKLRVECSTTTYPKFHICKNKGLGQNHLWTEFNDMDEAKKWCEYWNSNKVQKILMLFRFSNFNIDKIICKL